MAEVKREVKSESRDKKIEDLIVVIFIFIILQALFTYASPLAEKYLGISLSGVAQDRPLTGETPIGTKIIQAREGLIWEYEGFGNILGVAPAGILGEVVGGPVLREGEIWWLIEYEDKVSGFVSGNDILIDSDRDAASLKDDTPDGTRVVSHPETRVYSSAGDDALLIETLTEGEIGTIIGGPVYKNGTRWWQVRFPDGTVGWVSEDDLLIDVEKNIKSVNDNTPLLTDVVTTENTDVWSSPRFGVFLGRQEEGAEGILVEGSVTVGTTRWWNVDFEAMPDGWVLENVLEKKFITTGVAEETTRILKPFSFGISLIFIIGIVMVFRKFQKLIIEESHRYKSRRLPVEGEIQKDDTWERVTVHITSSNPTDWRLAILEADIMLEDLTESLGLSGDTLGERLMHADKNTFMTLDKAWEAHKARNQIVHEGGEFVLTLREAKRIIELYKDVFEEFHKI